MKKISFDEIDIYRIDLGLSSIDIEMIKQTIFANNNLSVKPSYQSEDTQYQMLFSSIRLDRVIDKIKTYLHQVTNTQEDDCTHLIMWNYITNKDEKDTYFHVHNREDQNGYMVPNVTHTFCLYISLPDKDPGYLWFKNKNGGQDKIKPNVGELLIFPASAEHMPELAPNSTNDRVVLAGNFINTKNNFNNE